MFFHYNAGSLHKHGQSWSQNECKCFDGLTSLAALPLESGICTCEPEECQNLTYILYWKWDNTFVLSRGIMSTPHLSWTWDLLRAVPNWIDSWDFCSHVLLYKTKLFCLVSLQMSHCLVCIPSQIGASRVIFYYLTWFIKDGFKKISTFIFYI